MKNNIIKGTLILTAAGIITRILGFVYRIYMANVIGAEGMGLYQLILPVYTLGWAIACSGFTTTVSKLTAQENIKGEYGNVRRVLKQSVTITAIIGFALMAVLYIFAENIAVSLFGDSRMVMSLQVLAFAFPFMAAGSCIRGFFYGLQNTVIPAANQVMEQLVRMMVFFILITLLMPKGIEFAVTIAIIGLVAEEVFSFFFILVTHRRYASRQYGDKKATIPRYHTLSMIFTNALPHTGNRVIGSLLATVENVLIPARLAAWGLSQSQAIAVYGQVTGMALPLIFFPTAILTALSSNLIPAIAEAKAVKNNKSINRTASMSILFASIVGFGAAGLFITFSYDLGMLIYNQNLSAILIPFGLMAPFMYMQVILAGLLNGLGHQVFIFRNSLLSSVINIGFIYFLVPKFGISMFIIGWFISLIIVCALELHKLRKSININLEFVNWFVKPFIAGVCASVGCMTVRHTVLNGNVSLTATVGLITFFGFVYFLLIIMTGAMAWRDIKRLFKAA